jgi:hypothetical protein
MVFGNDARSDIIYSDLGEAGVVVTQAVGATGTIGVFRSIDLVPKYTRVLCIL